MMRYYKLMDGERLTAIGTGAGGTEISAEEYAALADESTQKAALADGLSTDLEFLWKRFPKRAAYSCLFMIRCIVMRHKIFRLRKYSSQTKGLDNGFLRCVETKFQKRRL